MRKGTVAAHELEVVSHFAWPFRIRCVNVLNLEGVEGIEVRLALFTTSRLCHMVLF